MGPAAGDESAESHRVQRRVQKNGVHGVRADVTAGHGDVRVHGVAGPPGAAQPLEGGTVAGQPVVEAGEVELLGVAGQRWRLGRDATCGGERARRVPGPGRFSGGAGVHLEGAPPVVAGQGRGEPQVGVAERQRRLDHQLGHDRPTEPGAGL
ncbi:hypothetical protein EES47_29870 [Streptomyces sp. ADI98-12]|nr:hypothetical protein EES47_29870 [Streptomyces sp. ADI98-12]